MSGMLFKERKCVVKVGVGLSCERKDQAMELRNRNRKRPSIVLEEFRWLIPKNSGRKKTQSVYHIPLTPRGLVELA